MIFISLSEQSIQVPFAGIPPLPAIADAVSLSTPSPILGAQSSYEAYLGDPKTPEL